MLPIKKILCPIDYSPPSLAALQAASELAEHFDAELQVLHVLPPTPAFPPDVVVIAVAGICPSDTERGDDAMLHLNNLIVERVPLAVRALGKVKIGPTAQEINSVAEDNDIDLIVMGTHGTTGWRHLAFGSVTESVMRHADRPVLTVHEYKTKARGPIHNTALKQDGADSQLPKEATVA